jgi:hypothetical protein
MVCYDAGKIGFSKKSVLTDIRGKSGFGNLLGGKNNTRPDF